MEWIITVFAVFIFVDTFLLIAIAGSLYKLIVLVQTMAEEPIIPTVGGPANRKMPEGYRMIDGEWVQLPNLTYDMAVMRGEEQPFADGLKERPVAKNWDGVSPQDS